MADQVAHGLFTTSRAGVILKRDRSIIADAAKHGRGLASCGDNRASGAGKQDFNEELLGWTHEIFLAGFEQIMSSRIRLQQRKLSSRDVGNRRGVRAALIARRTLARIAIR